MLTGWNVTIKAFLPVNPNDPDTVIGAAEVLKRLNPKVRKDSGEGTVTDVGNAFRKLENVEMKSVFINKRDLPETKRPNEGVGEGVGPV